MPLPAKNAPCPCCSGRNFNSCCAAYLAGDPAPTPEALMRSRYTAYASGQSRYIMATTAAESPHRETDAVAWKRDLDVWSAATTFLRLDVNHTHIDGDRGEVHFFATLSRDGRDTSFGERSRFVRRDGRWSYIDGGGAAI